MEQKNNNLSIPLAIVFAGILIAGAVVFTNSKGESRNIEPLVNAPQEPQYNLEAVRPVDDRDYVRGDRNAPIMIVEYSDTECPFCKQFHASMREVIGEYASTGKVAWVYRHFPLDQLHRKAREEAHALECAGEIGGNDKFWQYTDRLYEITPANDGLDLAELPRIAAYVGIDVARFNTCMESGRHNEKIESDLQNAVAMGGRGTPWSVIVVKNEPKTPLPGALPASNLRQILDEAISNL